MNQIICPRCRRKVRYLDHSDYIELELHDYDAGLLCSQPPIKKVFDPRELAQQRAAEEALATEIAEALGLTIPHQWERDEDGDINEFALEVEYHNGPRCVRCEEVFCEHCNPEMWGEPCGEQTPNLF